jgi:hypothetical protein
MVSRVNEDLEVKGNLSVMGGNSLAVTGDARVDGQLHCKCCGIATLVNGEATVETEMVTDRSFVFTAYQAKGGNPGHLGCESRVAGVSFTVASSNVNDAGTFVWMLVEHIGPL